MEELTKTYIYKMIYREIEPIVHNHFNKKQTQEKLGDISDMPTDWWEGKIAYYKYKV